MGREAETAARPRPPASRFTRACVPSRSTQFPPSWGLPLPGRVGDLGRIENVKPYLVRGPVACAVRLYERPACVREEA
jgi:hypothetical protein